MTFLEGRNRAIVNQTHIGTASKTTLGKLQQNPTNNKKTKLNNNKNKTKKQKNKKALLTNRYIYKKIKNKTKQSKKQHSMTIANTGAGG